MEEQDGRCQEPEGTGAEEAVGAHEAPRSRGAGHFPPGNRVLLLPARDDWKQPLCACVTSSRVLDSNNPYRAF